GGPRALGPAARERATAHRDRLQRRPPAGAAPPPPAPARGGGRRRRAPRASPRLPAPLARGSVRVWAPELSTAAILQSIKKGRVVVMGDGRTPPPVVTLRAGGRPAGAG